MNEMPMLRQLLICEKIIFEQGSGNVSLINCHSTRIADQFPSSPADFVVYGLLSDGFGTFTMQTKVWHIDMSAMMYQQSFPMIFSDRLRESNVICRVAGAVFPAEGRYQIDLYANDQLLGMTILKFRRRRR